MGTSPIAPQGVLQPTTAPKLRKSRKAPAVKTAVIAKRAQGQSITNIARDLRITRNTTRTIIAESDIDRQIQSGQLQSLSLIPKALKVADMRLEKGSETMAIEVLRQSIWPLNAKQGKAGDPGLTVAINQLMGNVTVQSQATQQDTEAKSIEASQAKPTE